MKSRKPSAVAARVAQYAVLCLGAFFTLLPFLWMISSSLKTPAEIVRIPPVMIPETAQFSNYAEAWAAAPFGRYLINTVIVTILTTAGVLVTSVLSAFAFSRLKFPGKDLVFSLFMATLMIPGEMLIITNFMTITKLKWIDTYQAMVIPWISNVFYIYLLTQFFMQVPDTLYLAAKVDKCSDLKFMLRIMVPMNKSAITTIAILNIIGSWNSFLWPLLVLRSSDKYTLPIGLNTLVTPYGNNYDLLIVGSFFSVLPILILFLCFQKYFIEGMTAGAVKG